MLELLSSPDARTIHVIALRCGDKYKCRHTHTHTEIPFYTMACVDGCISQINPIFRGAFLVSFYLL